MPEFLYNEEAELGLDELIETEEEEFAEQDPAASTEEILDEIAEGASSEKRAQLVEDIESGNVTAGQGGDGDYAISKNIAEDDSDVVEEKEADSSPVVEEFSSDVDSVETMPSNDESVEEFTQTTDAIPEKKVSVSIEQLRKKMNEDGNS